MPFKSKAQMRKFFAMENRGELPKGKAKQWAHETPSIKRLPERKKEAYDLGVQLALEDAGLVKSAAIDPKVVEGLKSLFTGSLSGAKDFFTAKKLRGSLAQLGGLKGQTYAPTMAPIYRKQVLEDLKPYLYTAGLGGLALATPSILGRAFPGADADRGVIPLPHFEGFE